MILPNFLYLGSEITTIEQAEELQGMGIKRILNMAIECDDDIGLAGIFEKYKKIPMRDHVEEDNVVRGMREACQFLGQCHFYSFSSPFPSIFIVWALGCVVFGRYLPFFSAFFWIDDARLHSSATFVHCKAGKSRSVTAVIAYLIHANHWDRDRAYNFVVGRRKGISPNIGFMSELMNFEKEELCGKVFNTGGGGNEQPVVASASTDTSGDGVERGEVDMADIAESGTPSVVSTDGTRSGPSRRLLAHIRDSLPPKLHQHNSSTVVPGSVLDRNGATVVDHAGEMEVKDAEGRYRHARRAPVDELTLQPMRRVSKAGLESASWS